MKTRGLYAVVVALALILFGALGALAQEQTFCGEPEVFTLWGGKTSEVGTVTVSNDEDNLYVTYKTSDDWFLEECHLYVLDSEPTERLTPGQAPYKSGELTDAQEYTFTVPLEELDFSITCDETALWLQAHASVVKIVNGEVVQSETAYGGEINQPVQGSWYGNIEYLFKCCEDLCWSFDETAWAAGNRYVTKGNWATFTPYVADGEVDLFAAQNIKAGTVKFSATTGGEVTITITLEENWFFADTGENVKIQDYAEAPTGNPSPGGFEYKGDATGQSFEIEVPANTFYGIHADVSKWVPCVE